MAWITIIAQVVSLLIKYGPDLMALVKSIFDHLHHVRDPAARLAFAQEVEVLARAYQGDKRPLIDLLKRIADHAGT